MGIRNTFRVIIFHAVAALIAASAGCGDNGNVQVTPPTPQLALFAGDVGGFGSGDGVGTEARFLNAHGIAADGSGGFLITDDQAHTIRRIDTAARVTSVAGGAKAPGSDDGPAATASFNGPMGIASDGNGNIYIADTGNQTIRRIGPDGIVSTFAGLAGSLGSADGAGAAARFSSPRGVAVDRDGNVYVADTGNQMIRRIGPVGIVSTFAGLAGARGSADGVGAAARFNTPTGVAVDRDGTVFVTDAGNYTVRRISSTGTVTTLAGAVGVRGYADGVGADARFNYLEGLTVDAAGDVYVAEASRIRIIRSDGTVSTHPCTAVNCGGGALLGVAIDDSGAIFATVVTGHPKVALESSVRKFTPAGEVFIIAGRPPDTAARDGVGSAARFVSPFGLAANPTGDVFVADKNAESIRRITSDAAVTTFARGLRYPAGVAADIAGNLYVTEASNIHATWEPYPPPARNVISKITPDGKVTIFAGSPFVAGSADGQGADARFSEPAGIAVDRSGNIYVVDNGNSTIRKISPAGMVSTLAGLAGSPGSADGVGSEARFRFPYGVTVDGAGNVFVADANNHTIRRISPDGVVSTLAGAAGVPGSADGVGAEARFRFPYGLSIDAAGNLYVADNGNRTIRRVTPSGTVSTIVGQPGVNGFAPGGLPGVISGPVDVAISGSSLYITMSKGVAIVRTQQ